MFEAIRNILAEELGLSAESIQPQSDLVEEFGISEIELVNLLLEIEEEFLIRTDESILPALHTVDDISEYVETLIG